jgi:4-hydroxy-tetrahydrodipicolinate synthase
VDSLADHPHIVAVKEASANLAQITEIIRGRPSRFAVLSGDDPFTLPLMVLGGDGIISVVSNATQKLMAQLYEACARGAWDQARELHMRLVPWFVAAFVESNPIPVKAALAMMGRIANVPRLPLVPLADAHAATVRKALVDVGALDA